MSTTSSASPPAAGAHTSLALAFEAVSIRYQLYQGRRPLLQDYLASMLAQRPLRRDVWALRDVSFSVQRGEVFGLVGSNGSGKSTLLKVVARILRPTAGRVVVHGNVAPLIELGAGFQPDLTGRENVLLKSAILGHAERDTRKRIGQIVDFAGLHEFIDAPLHTYSSGMVARLAFAVATDVQPDILIIDEVLAVGDAEFRERSEQRIADLRRAGTTILIVSHNSAALRRTCDRVGWLAYGRLQIIGDVDEIIGAYEGGLRVEPGVITADGAAAPSMRRAAALAIDLQVDDKLFVLEAPGEVAPTFAAVVEPHFDPDHISPFNNRASLPPGARLALAPYRLVRGAFFYDQMAQLLSQTPICATFLHPPATRGLAAPCQPADGRSEHDDQPTLTAISNRMTRMLGQCIPRDGAVPHDLAYLSRPLEREDLKRACAVLDSLAFVGLAARPRESLLLLWYTFGWPPDQELLAQIPPDSDSIDAADRAELEQLNRFDVELYEHACRLFDRRFDLMTHDLIDRYAHAATQDLTPPLPLELQIGLLRQHHQRRRAERSTLRTLRFSFDRPVPGTGWYGVEYNPQHGTFRWTGPDNRSTIQLPLDRELAAANLSLRCRILLASRPSVLKSLRFFVNDRPLPMSQLRLWDGSIVCEGAIPPMALRSSRFVKVTLEVDKTMIPAATALEYQESRRLGVALSWLELAPVETYTPNPIAVADHQIV